MGMKNLSNEGGCYTSNRIRDANNSKPINFFPIKSLEVLSAELSEAYARKVEVVDVLEEDANESKVHSLINGKTFDDFLNGYEFNNSDFSLVTLQYIVGLNKEKSIMENYRISLVFKEV